MACTSRRNCLRSDILMRATSLSLYTTDPWVGRWKPSIIRPSVVLPLPDSPATAVMSEGSDVSLNETSLTATFSLRFQNGPELNTCETFRNSSAVTELSAAMTSRPDVSRESFI